MKNFVIIVLLVIFIRTNLSADTLYCIKDQVFTGIITKSTETHIHIKDKNTSDIIPKTAVIKVLFSRADIILFNNNDSLKCKIVKKQDESINIINERGILSFHENEIRSLKYNESDTLTVKTLPVTGEVFVNKPPDAYHSFKFKRSYYLQFSPGYHTCKSKFRVPEGTQKVNSVEGLKIGGEVGFAFTDTISAGLGIETFLPDDYVNKTNFDNAISYTFLYLSSKISYRPLNISVVSYFAGIDLGLLYATEEILLPLGQTLKANSSGIAYRIKVGSSIKIKNVEASFNLAYLFAGKHKFKHSNPEFKETFFVFDGLSLNVGIRFLFYRNEE